MPKLAKIDFIQGSMGGNVYASLTSSKLITEVHLHGSGRLLLIHGHGNLTPEWSLRSLETDISSDIAQMCYITER